MDIAGENIGGLQLQLLDAAQNGNDQPSDNVNISDVLEAVANADPSFGAGAVAGGAEVMAQPPTMPQATVEIVEQPAPKALRFRYECEGRSAGSIPGVHNTPENKTYPTIRINNYIGQATIVVSCVTKDEPFRPHPHNLVGREGCQRGVFTFKTSITEDAKEYQFKNLGIQCVKRRDIADALQTRATLRVDPFRTGFEHRNNPQSIDLNAVRLAFQVFLHDAGGGARLFQLRPAVSDVIYDKKAMCDLLIMRASHCSGTVHGGTQIILLCEKVTREDTAVVFYQEDGAGRVLWEAPATTVLVHKQVAIVFESPPYAAPHYQPRAHRGQIHVHFQLKRLTDNQRSNSLPFEYIPDFQDSKKRKAVMPPLTTYETERYSLEPPIKIEPNRTPPHIYSPPMQSYTEAQQQWTPLEPMRGSSHNPFVEAGAWGPAYPAAAQYGAPSPYGVPSPYGAPSPQGPVGSGSPLGALSPHANLQSPLAPTVHSPLGPTMSPSLLHHPHQQQQQQQQHQQQQHQQQQQQQQQQPTYQMQEQMDTASSTPSLSALLNADVGPLQPELFSLSSLVEDRENLSDSLRQLSTNDLFHN